MPFTDDDDYKPYLETSTQDIKLVSDYTHLNFNECMELDCYTFKVLCRDAFIYKMSQSVEGREYLEDCHTLTLTSPDKSKLREYFN